MKITSDMIDYEGTYFDTPIVTVNGRRYSVTTERDIDSTPLDADCYSDDDIALWSDDQWHYVGVIVTPLDVPLGMQFQLNDSLWAVEFDFLLNPPQTIDGKTYRYTDMDYIVRVYPVPDMIEEVIYSEQKYLTEVAIQAYVYS